MAAQPIHRNSGSPASNLCRHAELSSSEDHIGQLSLENSLETQRGYAAAQKQGGSLFSCLHGFPGSFNKTARKNEGRSVF